MNDVQSKKLSIGIVFSKNNSNNFISAQKRAKALSEFGELIVDTDDKGIESRFNLTINTAFVENAVKIDNLKRLVYTWKGTELLINNEPSTKREFEFFIEKFLELRRCWNTQKRRIMKASKYPCVDDFTIGCKYLRLDAKHELLHPFNYYGEPAWFTVGDFDGNVVNIDKEIIRKQIRDVMRYKSLSICPYFDESEIERCIAKLPDILDPNKDTKYAFIYERGKDEPVWVIPKDFQNRPYGFSFEKNESLVSHGGMGFNIQFGQDQLDKLKEKPQRIIPTIRYDDVRGQKEAVEAVRDYVELPIKYGKLFKQIGVESGKGVLLYGPPGNGKTLLAKAVAGEAGAHIEIISGPEILSKWVGGSERNLRLVFEKARELEPSIILFDEIDSIAPSRETVEFHHQKELVSQLLVLLDGLEERGQVIVIATTNRIDDIDPAIKRPGRFDRMVYVGFPDVEGRKDIFKKYLSKMNISENVSLEILSTLTQEISGAQIEHLCREAGLICIKEAIKDKISEESIAVRPEHFVRAIELVKP